MKRVIAPESDPFDASGEDDYSSYLLQQLSAEESVFGTIAGSKHKGIAPPIDDDKLDDNQRTVEQQQQPNEQKEEQPEADGDASLRQQDSDASLVALSSKRHARRRRRARRGRRARSGDKTGKTVTLVKLVPESETAEEEKPVAEQVQRRDDLEDTKVVDLNRHPKTGYVKLKEPAAADIAINIGHEEEEEKPQKVDEPARNSRKARDDTTQVTEEKTMDEDFSVSTMRTYGTYGTYGTLRTAGLDEDQTVLLEEMMKEKKRRNKGAGVLARASSCVQDLKEEITGTYQDTVASMSQVCCAFTLTDKDLRVVSGHIRRSRREFSKV